MKKGQLFTIGIAVVLLISAGIIYRSQSSRFDWYETYSMESKQPYGGYIISEILKDYFPSGKFKTLNKPIQDYVKTSSYSGHENYIFIGNQLQFDSAELDAIFSFVAKGNTAFISAAYCDVDFLEKLFGDSCLDEDNYYYSQTDSVAKLNFYNPSLEQKTDYKLTYVFRNEPYEYTWTLFDSSFFCGENGSVAAVGYLQPGYPNFIRKAYGRGEFFYHTTPLIFTNYALTKKENLDYASKAFSYLSKGNIVWDEYNKLPGDLSFNSKLRLSQSPLQFILSQESLRWAWYIALLLLLLYMIFFGRRRQRVIPVIEPRTNTSMEFVNTIGQLYYQQQNHKAICRHKMKMFRSFLRQRYSLSTQEVNPELFQKISVKSQIAKENIAEIFDQMSWFERNLTISEDELIHFHKLLENFYKNCK